MTAEPLRVELVGNTDYCFLGFDWWPICMQKAEWASWVQAIGSIVAIGIAIWLPLRMHQREQAAIKQVEFDTAVVIGSGLLLQLSQIGGTLSAWIETMDQTLKKGSNPRVTFFYDALNAIDLPEVEQILALRAIHLKLPIEIAQGNRYLRQLLNLAQPLTNNEFPQEGVKEMIGKIRLMALLAEKSTRDALQKLETFYRANEHLGSFFPFHATEAPPNNFGK